MGVLHDDCALVAMRQATIPPDICRYLQHRSPAMSGMPVMNMRFVAVPHLQDWKGEPLTPQLVNLYDVCGYVIKPATVEPQSSYIELVAEGPQRPKTFVSHWCNSSLLHCFPLPSSNRIRACGSPNVVRECPHACTACRWGEPVNEFVSCLLQHSADQLADPYRPGTAHLDQPYWVRVLCRLCRSSCSSLYPIACVWVLIVHAATSIRSAGVRLCQVSLAHEVQVVCVKSLQPCTAPL